MANDGQIVFEVTADGKHAIANIREITKAIQQEAGKWDAAAGSATDGIESKFSGMLKKLAAGFSVAKIGQALINLGKEAINAASDLEEVQNVVDVTFGDNANKIEKWAKAAGDQFGLTETKAKQFTSTMGAMLKSSGLAGDKIVEMSTDLAGLAADMSSFYNLDFDEAFAKIRSGISGQTMPLKELGIDMSVATLNAFALSKGLDKTFEKMSQGEQVALRYQYLMQATADAQGDFARTSDGYANALRNFESKVEGLKTVLGAPFLKIAADATNALTGFIEKLMPDESKKTVLDDFAEIDLKTEEKLSQIRTTAEEAQSLTGILQEISGYDTSDAIGKIAEGANRLNSSSPSTWKALLTSLTDIDGLSNIFTNDNADKNIQDLANALSGASVDTNKAEAWKTFLGALSDNADAVSKLTGDSVEGTKEWLNGLSESINSIDPNDAAAWDNLLTTLVSGFTGTPEGQKFIEGMATQFLAMGKDSQEASDGLARLGYSSEQIADKQALWLETCKRLVQTIPGLSSIINTETGEVKGGVQAIEDYIKAWEQGQTKLTMMKALEQKKTAIDTRFADMPGLELDMRDAQRKVREQAEVLRKAYKQAGMLESLLPLDELMRTDKGYYRNTDLERMRYINGLKMEYNNLVDKAKEAEDAYNAQADALAKANEDVKGYEKTVKEMAGDIDEAGDAQKDWLTKVGKSAEEVQKLADNTKEALTNLADYAKGVHDAVESAVNSTVSGFGKIETPMMKNSQKVKDITKQLANLDQKSKDYLKDKNKLEETLFSTQGEQVSAQSMGNNLYQQARFMDDYLKNLEKARKMGFSNEVLAALSDGSEESYDYLEALANASEGEKDKINHAYEEVIKKKKKLTDELSKQQLSADKTYQTLAEKAKEAIKELDLEEEAKTNAGKTVSAVAKGVSDHLGEVTEAVNAIIAEVERLSGLGIDVTLNGVGFSGGGDSTSSGGATAEAGASGGMDFVPKDMFARIHQGESILKAEEAAVYRQIKNGGIAGVDMETLGGVMRDNIKGGGNVYLDGKIVGSVISDRQGRSYKSLQRSGWMA